MSNQDTITSALYSFFTGKGFSPAQATIATAGAEGNLQTESSFNPAAYNTNEGAQGIAQWEGGRGDNGALGAYAAKTGGSVTSLTTQIGFLESELNGPYAGTVAGLRSASTPAQAALVWAQDFEGNAPASDGARESNAASIYQGFKGNLASLAAGVIPASATATETSATSSIAGDILGPIGNYILKGVLVIGGLGLVVVGLYRASGAQPPSLKDAAALAAA